MFNYRAADQSIIPTLFIGMGGTGSRIVDRIANRAEQLPHWDAQLRSLVQFVVVDTNDLDQDKLSPRIPKANRINLAAFDKVMAVRNYREAKDAQVEQWLPPDYWPREGIKPGAGQIRLESRLGFFFNSVKIKHQLQNIVRGMLHTEHANWRKPQKFNVYLFATLAGGTGSGSAISMAYLVDAVVKEQGCEAKIIGNILLSTLLTRVVQPGLHPNIHANTYAALKEIEFLTKLGNKQVRQMGREQETFAYWHDLSSREPQSVRKGPFFLGLIYDDPGKTHFPDFEAAIADTCFLQLFSPIQGDLEGELDNYEQHMETLTVFPGRPIGQGYTKNFGCVGAAALVLPGQELLRYCSYRFAAGAIRQQITFGMDRGGNNGGRAERLEQYAVDYTDKKFQNLDASERARLINKMYVKRVQEMAAIDREEEMPHAYWAKLVEQVDLGEMTRSEQSPTKENAEPTRNPSVLKQILTALDEDRDHLFQKVQIDVPGFTFHRESVSQYDNEVDRLDKQFRVATALVADQEEPLISKARTGQYIERLRMDPLRERYVVLRLLEFIESEGLPAVTQDVEKRANSHIGATKIQEKLRNDNKQRLVDAAASKTWYGASKEEDFLSERDQASTDFKKVAIASREFLKATLKKKQYTAMWEYLRQRADTYAALSIRMDKLVNDLESHADRIRAGDDWLAPPLALRVEVFQRLEGGGDGTARERIWDAVYQTLYIDEGRYMTTFNREILANTIREQFKPVVLATGRTQPKTLNQIEDDIRAALLKLGESTLARAIFGSEDGTPPLSLVDGLELEAHICEPATRDNPKLLHQYLRRKVRALGAVAGVIARANLEMARTARDGVVEDGGKRRVVVGRKPGTTGGNAKLVQLLAEELNLPINQIKDGEEGAYNPHLAIIHDSATAIPLYYITAINREIQPHYLALQNDPRRKFNLHTDYQWEKALPDLDPQRGSLALDWTLQTMADAVRVKLVVPENGWWLRPQDKEKHTFLGETLTAALYRFERLYAKDATEQWMKAQMADCRKLLGETGVEANRLALVHAIGEHLHDITMAESGFNRKYGFVELSKKLMDKPALEALRDLLQQKPEAQGTVVSGPRF